MQHRFFQDNILKFKPYLDYEHNAHGYRTHEITDDNLDQPHWYVFGESNTFGIGINDGQRFSERLENHLNQKVFNFARPGASGEECVRILYGFTDTVQKPQGVIVVWPYLVRRNHYSITRSYPVYLTGSSVDKSMIKHLVNNNDDMDVAHFYNQMYFVEHWCKQKSVPVYHFMIEQEDIVLLQNKSWFDDKICATALSDCANLDDLANDDAHWGPLHHKVFAHTIEGWIKD